MEQEYLNILNTILGEKLFNELSNELYNRVNKVYLRIRTNELKKIVECNMAIILIIGIEIGRGCSEEKIADRIEWYNICSKSMLIERTIATTKKVYERYIKVISNKTIKNVNKT